jgi:hypothetical protein
MFTERHMKQLFLAAALATPLFAAMPAAVHAATPPAILKWDSSVKGWEDSYYWYDPDQKRYAFTSEQSFESWFPGSPTGVVNATIPELAPIALGGAVYHRPATRLLKFESSPDVYAVARYGMLRKIATEQVAFELYGADWKTYIDEVPVTDFPQYRLGATITDAGEYDRTAYNNLTNPSGNVVNATNRAPEAFDAKIALSTNRGDVRVGDRVTLTASASTRDAWNTVTIRFYDWQNQVVGTCKNTVACSVTVTAGGPVGSQPFTARAFNAYEQAVESKPVVVSVSNPQ